MSNSKACADYFKQKKGYDRCFRQMRKKWESYGRAAGQIVLSSATEEERRALTGIFGKTFYEESVEFSLAEFEQVLQTTRFAPVTLKEVLEAYFGEALCTNQEKRADQQRKKTEFWERLAVAFACDGRSGWALRWLQAMEETRSFGYSMLNMQYRKNPEEAFALAQEVGAALERMVGLTEAQEELPLAVLAAEITNHPHAFDRGTAAGNLLMHAVSWYKNCQYPQNAYLWRILLLEMGIAPDNLSSSVTEYGLHLKIGDKVHPAYEAFNCLGEPGVVTMEHMKRITGAYSDAGVVYVVENQMVFSYLLNYVEPQEALLCTSGQLRSASRELIGFLVKSGMQIYYSGDIDPEGMLIADKLWQRYPDNLHIWRMSKTDYIHSVSDEKVDQKRLGMLELLRNPILKDTALQLKKTKKAGYQENILLAFVEDISRKGE